MLTRSICKIFYTIQNLLPRQHAEMPNLHYFLVFQKSVSCQEAVACSNMHRHSTKKYNLNCMHTEATKVSPYHETFILEASGIKLSWSTTIQNPSFFSFFSPKYCVLCVCIWFQNSMTTLKEEGEEKSQDLKLNKTENYLNSMSDII